MTKESESVKAKSAFGDFYFEETCCMSCGVPQEIAPDFVGWTSEDLQQCYWVKQPQTADEIETAPSRLFMSRKLGVIDTLAATGRYSEDFRLSSATMFVRT